MTADQVPMPITGVLKVGFQIVVVFKAKEGLNIPIKPINQVTIGETSRFKVLNAKRLVDGTRF